MEIIETLEFSQKLFYKDKFYLRETVMNKVHYHELTCADDNSNILYKALYNNLYNKYLFFELEEEYQKETNRLIREKKLKRIIK